MEKILHPKKLRQIDNDQISRFQSVLRSKGRAEATIKSYLKHLRAALRWAVDMGMLSVVPKIQWPTRGKDAKLMKGRPITGEEFERMLAKVATVLASEDRRSRDAGSSEKQPKQAKEPMSPAAIASWRRLLRGLWLSGLRLSEALNLFWDRDDKLCVDLDGRRPMLWIPAELEKGNTDRLLSTAPEFAFFLLETPEDEREGPVFRLLDRSGKERAFGSDWVSRVICRIGKAAGVKVNTSTKTGKIKYASAHDFRRSFGERWAPRVMPIVLKELMRHESIETTMKFYVGRNAQNTAEALRTAYETHENEKRSQSTPLSKPETNVLDEEG